MKKFFKRFGKRITSIVLTVLIIIISVITPFFTSSAFVVTASSAAAIAGVAALVGSLAAGLASGTVQDISAKVVNDMSNYVDETTQNFNEFVKSFFDGYTIDGVSVNGSDISQYVDYTTGTATINFDEYENLRKQFAGSLYKPESDLVDDYLSLGGLPVLFRGNSFTLTAPEASSLISKYSDRLCKGNLVFVLLAKVAGEWCLVNFSGNMVVCGSINGSSIFYMNSNYPSSTCVSATFNFSNSKLTTYGTNFTGGVVSSYSYDCKFYRVGDLSVVSGTPSESVVVLLDKNCSWTYNSSSVNSYIKNIISADTAIAGTVEIPDTDFKKNDIENTVINGQGVGVVSQNPTLTFVPTDTATGAADVAIDDVPVAEVEKTIADIGEFNDTFADSLPDISDNWTTISIPSTSSPDINTPLGMLKQKLTSKFPVIDQLNTFFNNLFNTDYDSTAPNFHFYWDSNGDGEVERYNALDLSFLETTLTNEYLEDKDRFAAPINLRLFIHLIIILIVYVQFAVKLFKMLPSFFGFGSDFTGNIVTEISREPDTRYHDTGIGFKG